MNQNYNGASQLLLKMLRGFKEGKTIFCNEGSSRSGKTRTTFYFLWLYMMQNQEPKNIYFFRNTLVDAREILFSEFISFANDMKMSNFILTTTHPKPTVRFMRHRITFAGIDDEKNKEGFETDFIFFNEALDIKSIDAMRGFMMRCKNLIVMDWNPKFTEHDLFKFEKRKDTLFTRSTYLDNLKNLSPRVIEEIEGYNPAVPSNVEQGTADEYRWKVYGLGQRASRAGLVFQNVNYVSEIPEDVDDVAYGLDFGQNAPTAFVKLFLKGKNIYLKKLFYAPLKTSGEVIEVIKSFAPTKHIWSDNNMPGWILDIRNAEIEIFPTVKFDGSRNYWISMLNSYVLNIFSDVDFRREQENFSYRVVDGVALSETIKKYDHLWSASGYACVGDFRPK